MTRHRVLPPRGCAGSYYNGDIEYTVTVRGDDVALVVDDEPTARLVPHEGSIFSIIELNTGEYGRPGRFMRDSRGYIDRVQIGGRVARRQHRAREVA
jgi:antitoxin (DNA-binding transcriptional repressor) of toxin-antitoxin stability system